MRSTYVRVLGWHLPGNKLVFPWHVEADSVKSKHTWPCNPGHLDLEQAVPVPWGSLSPMQEGCHTAAACVGGAVGWG